MPAPGGRPVAAAGIDRKNALSVGAVGAGVADAVGSGGWGGAMVGSGLVGAEGPDGSVEPLPHPIVSTPARPAATALALQSTLHMTPWITDAAGRALFRSIAPAAASSLGSCFVTMIRESDGPVRVGSMLYTLVDPSRGHEAAYNRWYERDHFYGGCMIGPWILGGRRWVATRALKDLRFPQDGPIASSPEAGSYLAIYWIHEGHHDDHFDWGGEQVHRLYEQGRGFAERRHTHTGLYDYRGTVYRDADPVPIELALHHRFNGLVNVFLERSAETEAGAFEDWLAREPAARLTEGGPIAAVSSWRPHPREGGPTESAPMDLGSSPGGDERTLQLMFVDDEPQSAWDRVARYAQEIDDSGMARVLFASPFFPTVVGTDTYTDELW